MLDLGETKLVEALLVRVLDEGQRVPEAERPLRAHLAAGWGWVGVGSGLVGVASRLGVGVGLAGLWGGRVWKAGGGLATRHGAIRRRRGLTAYATPLSLSPCPPGARCPQTPPPRVCSPQPCVQPKHGFGGPRLAFDSTYFSYVIDMDDLVAARCATGAPMKALAPTRARAAMMVRNMVGGGGSCSRKAGRWIVSRKGSTQQML